jgi:hypothetical protein
VAGKTRVPLSGQLFQSVYIPCQVCDFISIPTYLREAHVDCLIKLAIQESDFVIKLLGDETIRSDDRQEMVEAIEMYH